MTQADVTRFLSLSPTQRFIEIRDLRTKAAHHSGGSLAAFTAIYLSVLFAALPLLSSAFTAAAGITGGTFTIGVILLLGGLWISYAFVRAQHRWARATVRLQFFQEAQSATYLVTHED